MFYCQQSVGGVLVSKAEVIREEVEEGERVFSGVLVKMKNAYIMLLSEGEENLGTLAVSLPQKKAMIGPPLSSILLGERNATLARLLAERLAGTVKKMALVSVFVRSIDEKKAGPTLLRLVEKMLKKGGGLR
jgi:hypothetical protein